MAPSGAYGSYPPRAQSAQRTITAPASGRRPFREFRSGEDGGGIVDEGGPGKWPGCLLAGRNEALDVAPILLRRGAGGVAKKATEQFHIPIAAAGRDRLDAELGEAQRIDRVHLAEIGHGAVIPP